MDFDKELLAKVKASAFKPQPVQEVKIDRRLLGESKTVLGEEKDPDDHKTGSLFPELDEPELQQIHHYAELSVDHPYNHKPTNYPLGKKTFTRKPLESAADFKARVFRSVEDGHSQYGYTPGRDEDQYQVGGYSPYNSFDEAAAEHGGYHASNGQPWKIHVASSHPTEMTFVDDSDDNLYKGASTRVNHYLQVGHYKSPNS